ncbi:MAG: ferredoxin family protein [Nitrososphaerota archaeon]|nr:ferredoxin family protein [Nitrososphaerota archaeon]
MHRSRGAIGSSLLAGLSARAELTLSPLDAFAVQVDRCSGDGDCAAACSVKVFETDQTGRCRVVNDFLCYGCMACVAQCLEGGVRIVPRREPRFTDMDELLR